MKLVAEFLILFILIPLSYVFPYPVALKVAVGLLGLVYCIYVLLTIEKVSFRLAPNIDWNWFTKQLTVKYVLLVLFSTPLVYLLTPKEFFSVMLNRPGLWIFILFFYSVFSVFPQEALYRTFFHKRYSHWFKNPRILHLINGLIFSLAHLFFLNYLVLILTFVGGILFSLLYYRTKSTFLVSLEHALLGNWLFTVGIGGLLGFPSG